MEGGETVEMGSNHIAKKRFACLRSLDCKGIYWSRQFLFQVFLKVDLLGEKLGTVRKMRSVRVSESERLPLDRSTGDGGESKGIKSVWIEWRWMVGVQRGLADRYLKPFFQC